MIPKGVPGKRRYGKWAGQPNGVPENREACVEQIAPRGVFISRQCSHSRGFGPNGEFCRKHAKKYTGAGVPDAG